MFRALRKVVSEPEDLIAREKMVDILYDLALINAGKAIDPYVMEENQVEPVSYVYLKYGIDNSLIIFIALMRTRG